MKIKVLIVEDEVLVAEDISAQLQESGFEVAGIALSSGECFSMIQKHEPHIILMDVRIQGKLDGIETTRIIEQTRKIPVIFLTANTDQATINRVLSVNPAAFISKPFNKKDLAVAIELASQKYNSNVLEKVTDEAINQFVFVKDGPVFRKLDISSILYIEASGSYSIVHTTLKPFTLSYNLNHFSNQLNKPVFKRVHRSFIVNVQKVEAFDHNSLLINKISIPVSKQYQKEVSKYFIRL